MAQDSADAIVMEAIPMQGAAHVEHKGAALLPTFVPPFTFGLVEHLGNGNRHNEFNVGAFRLPSI